MNSLLYSVDQLTTIKQSYGYELTKASRDEMSSVSFIPTELPHAPLAKEGEVFQVMIIGGSIFEGALAKKVNGHITLHAPKKAVQPIFKTRDDLLQFIDSHLDPSVTVLCFNFTFPMLSIIRDGILDGILARATKEHVFAGLVGEKVGETIEQDQLLRHGRKIHVTCANDTICLALSGLTKGISERMIGAGIIGTGYNLGFFSSDRVVANTESGNFDKFPFSESGNYVDSKSENKGAQRSEKEVAGRYLYQHFNYYAKQLGETQLSSTEALSLIAQNDDEAGKIARQLFERAASLVACQMVGAYEFIKQPQMTWVMEGSVFWKGWHYQENVLHYVEQLGIPKGAMQFVEIQNSGLLGAAELVI